MSAFTMPSLPPPLAARWHMLSSRERRLIALALALLLGVLLYLLSRGEAEPGVELSAAPPATMEAPLLSSPAPTPAPAAPPAAPSASVDGLILHGVLGGGAGGGAAIIAFPGGGQRWIRVGREFLPGVTLREVGIRHAILTTAGGDMRMEFNKAARLQAPPAAAASSGAGDPDARRRETLDFRMGLAPKEVNGRKIGYAVRAGAKLPHLARAGLQPGDVITKVNGNAFRSDEKVLELSEELATSYTAEIEYLRGGKPMKASLEMNKRSQ